MISKEKAKECSKYFPGRVLIKELANTIIELYDRIEKLEAEIKDPSPCHYFPNTQPPNESNATPK